MVGQKQIALVSTKEVETGNKCTKTGLTNIGEYGGSNADTITRVYVLNPHAGGTHCCDSSSTPNTAKVGQKQIVLASTEESSTRNTFTKTGSTAIGQGGRSNSDTTARKNKREQQHNTQTRNQNGQPNLPLL